MMTDRLYELAFQYKQTKLWKKLYDSDIFAVTLENGETAWCCVMGANGEHIALAAYVGNQGLRSWYELLDHADPCEEGLSEAMLVQNCVQCSFENKDMVSEESQKEIRAWAKAHQIALRGNNAYPQFVNYTPYLVPWDIDGKDEDILCQVLQAALYVSQQLEGTNSWLLGFNGSYAHRQMVPCVTKGKDGYSLSTVLMEKPEAEPLPAPKLTDELLTARFKACPKAGTFQCKLICLPAPVMPDEGGRPFFPFMVLAVSEENEMNYFQKPVRDYFNHPEEALNAFFSTFCENRVRPNAINVYDWDERTYLLLKDTCQKCNVKLKRQKSLSCLDIYEANILGCMKENGKSSIDMLVNTLEAMSPEELQAMPPEIRWNFKTMLEDGSDFLPENLRRKLEQALKD